MCGYAADHSWPVCWQGDWCWIFGPPDDGVVSADLFDKGVGYNHVVQTERAQGIRAIWDAWDKFVHFGDVPSEAARASTHPCTEEVP